MTPTLRVLGLLALAATLGPSILYLAGVLELERMQQLMLVATVAWFVVQGLAVYRKKESR